MQNSRLKFVHAATVAAVFSIIFITTITIAADLYSPIKDFLKTMFSHHWIGKGILASVLFLASSLVLYFLPGEVSEEKLQKNLIRLFWISVLGVSILHIFYFIETFIIK